ncbi:MAG: N-acetylmuramoyl-L-alanine amidase [Bacteroidetes bacterium]|nr:N-acetylmuramoyl-L-alanine amidase [Bacteroidota bacterium]
MIRSLFSSVIVFFLTAPILGAQPSLKLEYGKESKTIIPLYTGDQNFVSTRDLADLLKTGYFENLAKKKAVLSIGGHQIKITAISPFVVLDEDAIVQMPVDCQYIDETIFVPVKYFVPLLNSYLPVPLLVDGKKLESKAVTIVKEAGAESPTEENLTDVIFEKKTNGLLIRLKTKKDFTRDDVEIWRNKSWMYVTVSGAKYAPLFADNLKNGEQYKLIKSALLFQHKNSIQLSFQLNYETPGQEIQVDPKNQQILISVRVSDPAHLEQIKATTVSPSKDSWKIDKIVLDAGHGGWDNGASGKNGTREKNVTLAIVLKLGKLIEKQLGLKVEYTRSTDTYITLDGRTKYANARNAKLFVSVHCNSNVKRTAHGFETFFLSPSRTSEALAVARKENEVIEKEENSHIYGDFTDEKFILSNIMQSVFVRESEELADFIQKGLDKKLDLTNRGVSQAPFYVLMGASMPSVLVETAFISNPTEEKFLKSEAGQNKIAQGILDGIKQFISENEKKQKF